MNHFKLTRSCINCLITTPKMSFYGIGFKGSYKLRIGYI